MLRLVPKTYPYKGCDIPALGWEGDEDDVDRANDLWMRMRQARWKQHKWLLEGGSPTIYANATTSYARAAAETHQFYAEMGLSAEDAECAIFTARLDADVTGDGADTLERTGKRY